MIRWYAGPALIALGLALLFLVGCAPVRDAESMTRGVVTVNVLSPDIIELVCHGRAGCSEQVYYDGVPRVVTVWCSARHDVSACVLHELDHVARRSATHLAR